MNDVDWKKVWAHRGKDYHHANAQCPGARELERDLLIDQLALRPGLSLLDVAAGGGYLLEKIHRLFGSEITLLAIESSEAFAAFLPRYVKRIENGSIARFPLADGSVDRVTNLSGLHHSADRSSFFHEAFRVLKSDGILAAADVRLGSPVATWLNEFVDRYNPDGHDGLFFHEGEMTRLLSDAGFGEVNEETVRYGWKFESIEQMTWFCRTLFGLATDDATVLGGIREILGFEIQSDGAVSMNWELTRVAGRKFAAPRDEASELVTSTTL